MTPYLLFCYVFAVGFGLALSVLSLGICAGLVGIAFGWVKEENR